MKKLILLAAIGLTLSGIAQDTTRTTCKGMTVEKKDCKSVIVNKAGYCRNHNPEKITCSGTNSKKEPCQMVVKEKGQFCRFHQPTSK